MRDSEAFFEAVEIRERIEDGETDLHDPFEDAKSYASSDEFMDWWWDNEGRLRGEWIRFEVIYYAYLEYCWFGGFRPLSKRILQVDLGKRGVKKHRPRARSGGIVRPTRYGMPARGVTLDETWELAA